MIRDTDPLKTALVFNCGMGAVRTTFAMVAASMVRRKQMLDKGMPDPFGVNVKPSALSSGVLSSSPGASTVSLRRLILLRY